MHKLIFCSCFRTGHAIELELDASMLLSNRSSLNRVEGSHLFSNFLKRLQCPVGCRQDDTGFSGKYGYVLSLLRPISSLILFYFEICETFGCSFAMGGQIVRFDFRRYPLRGISGQRRCPPPRNCVAVLGDDSLCQRDLRRRPNGRRGRLG